MAEVSATRLPRRKKRTAGATPSREAKRRGGPSRSVLEALLAGEEDEEEESGVADGGDRRCGTGGRGLSRQSTRSAQKRKRRRKERQRMKRRMASVGAEGAGEIGGERAHDKENVPLDVNRAEQRRSNSTGDSARDVSSQDEGDDGAPRSGVGGSPVIQKRLFSSNQSSSSDENDSASEPAEEPAVDEAEEQRNYHRFARKYASAEAASVLEAVTPRDERARARRAAVHLPSPVQAANESALPPSRDCEAQRKETDGEADDEDWWAEVIPQDDDDKHDPTYEFGGVERRASLRSSAKKPRAKTKRSVKTESKIVKADAHALRDGASSTADESSGADSPVKTEKRRRRTRATILTNWSVEWPLQRASVSGRKPRGLRLVLVGEVNGEAARFEVAKRFTATHFMSSTDVSVYLDGDFKGDTAGHSVFPPGFSEIMHKGIPAHWKRHLAPFAPDGASPPAKLKPKRMATTLTRTPKAVESASRGKEPVKPMTPTMKWWTDASTTKVSDSPPVKKSTVPKKLIARANEKKTAPKKPPLAKRSAAAAKTKKESIAEPDDWTAEQLEALDDAKLKIPTTAPNFWAEVAAFVPGKSSSQCRARSFALYSTPPERKSGKGKKRALDASERRVPAKVARAGTNKFKKQVREFVEEYEKKNVDDIFAEQETPVKAPALAMDFDSLTSPSIVTPQKAGGSSEQDGDESEDAPTPGLLTKLTASKRDDVDSYVLGIKRRHTGIAIGAKAVRTSGLGTPTAAAKKTKGKAVRMMAEVGAHMLEGVVSPGGTTRVRIGKDGSSSDEEEDDEDEDDECSDLSDF